MLKGGGARPQEATGGNAARNNTFYMFYTDKSNGQSKPKPHIKRTNSMSCGKTGLTCFATSPGRPVVGPYRW